LDLHRLVGVVVLVVVILMFQVSEVSEVFDRGHDLDHFAGARGRGPRRRSGRRRGRGRGKGKRRRHIVVPAHPHAGFVVVRVVVGRRVPVAAGARGHEVAVTVTVTATWGRIRRIRRISRRRAGASRGRGCPGGRRTLVGGPGSPSPALEVGAGCNSRAACGLVSPDILLVGFALALGVAGELLGERARGLGLLRGDSSSVVVAARPTRRGQGTRVHGPQRKRRLFESLRLLLL
jgi:hypothetical protein